MNVAHSFFSFHASLTYHKRGMFYIETNQAIDINTNLRITGDLGNYALFCAAGRYTLCGVPCLVLHNDAAVLLIAEKHIAQ